MKILVTFISLLSSLHLYALQKNNYLIKTNLYINDQKMGSSQFRLSDGGTGSIEMQDNFISVTSIQSQQTPDSIPTVKMNFELGHYDKDGKKVVLGSPMVISQDSKLTTLIFTSKGGAESYKLEVVPKKITK